MPGNMQWTVQSATASDGSVGGDEGGGRKKGSTGSAEGGVDVEIGLPVYAESASRGTKEIRE